MPPRGVKAFTTWEYKDREATLPVPVYVVDENKQSYHRGQGDGNVYFKVELDDLDINERHSDVNKLREKVFKLIAARLTIEWKPMLVVEVSSSRTRLFDKDEPANTPDTNTNASGTITVSWSRWQIATVRGKKLSRSFNNYYTPMRFGPRDEIKEAPKEVWNASVTGWPNLGRGKTRRFMEDDEGDARAMIPDTPENRISLEAIADNIEKLYTALSQLLCSNQIEQTLAKIATQGLLALSPPPPPEKPKRGKSRKQPTVEVLPPDPAHR